MSKVGEELRHNPLMELNEGMKPMINYRRNKQAKDLEWPSFYYCCTVVGGMLVLFGCAFIPPPFLGPFEWLRSFYLFFFRTRRNLQMFFLVANLIHLGQAVFAWFLARRVDSAHAAGWFLQIFALGYGSLKLLLRMSKDKQSLKE